MSKPTKCNTAGCAGDPAAPGAAGGDCPRCYVWKRRHPNGPPPSSTPAVGTEGGGVEVKIVLSPSQKRAARGAAKKAGVKLSSWIRGLVVDRLGRSRSAR